MILIHAIELQNVKGVKQLSCTLEDFTLLAGLNNSGKTTVLQALHLIWGAINHISTMPDIAFNPHAENRRISLRPSLGQLGMRDVTSLFPSLQNTNECTIGCRIVGGHKFYLKPVQTDLFEFGFSRTDTDAQSLVGEWIREMAASPAEFVTPPGTVSSQEELRAWPDFTNMMGDGKGAQLWRNNSGGQ